MDITSTDIYRVGNLLLTVHPDTSSVAVSHVEGSLILTRTKCELVNYMKSVIRLIVFILSPVQFINIICNGQVCS